MRRIAARWGHHALTAEYKQARSDATSQQCKICENEREQFIVRIVAIDENWIRSYEPDLKRQSSELYPQASPRPIKIQKI